MERVPRQGRIRDSKFHTNHHESEQPLSNYPVRKDETEALAGPEMGGGIRPDLQTASNAPPSIA